MPRVICPTSGLIMVVLLGEIEGFSHSRDRTTLASTAESEWSIDVALNDGRSRAGRRIPRVQAACRKEAARRDQVMPGFGPSEERLPDLESGRRPSTCLVGKLSRRAFEFSGLSAHLAVSRAYCGPAGPLPGGGGAGTPPGKG